MHGITVSIISNIVSASESMQMHGLPRKVSSCNVFLLCAAVACEPGTFSATGLSPCKKCPTGSYQNASRASFCFYCNFGLITESEGSITKDDCSK